MDQNQNRLKSQMVLYRLEQGLGRYVAEMYERSDPSEKAQKYYKRLRETYAVSDDDDIITVIQESYLSELLEFARALSLDRSTLDSIKRLHELFQQLELFKVRNACAHPNRSFPPVYWYRTAATASDPCIGTLRLPEVDHALKSAEEGRIEEPPEGWSDRLIWRLPNNLPATAEIEHSATTLIGRAKQVASLKKKIHRHDCVAITGPGGMGKTALLLETLKQLVNAPSTEEHFDRIVYFTAKTAVLQASGVQRVENPVGTIENLRESVVEHLGYDAFAESSTANNAPKERILFCIDNLETLLIDNPGVFEDFYADTIPNNWKVVVTSRVSVDGAMPFRIENLQVEHLSQLARAHGEVRGIKGEVDSDSLDRLAEQCAGNPLTMKIAIDCYAAGQSLPDATLRANEGVLEFCFQNLFDSLNADAQHIVECLFVHSRPIAREDLRSILSLNVERLAEGLASLQRTSIIHRRSINDVENYSLTELAHNYLQTRPLNREVRARLHETIDDTRHAFGPNEIQHHELHWGYIPSHLSIHKRAKLDDYVVRVRQATGPSTGDLPATLLEELNREAPREPVIQRLLAYCLLHPKVLDYHNGEARLERLCRNDVSFDPPATLMLLSHSFQRKQYDRVQELFEVFQAQGWYSAQRVRDDRRLEGAFSQAVKKYYLSRIFSHQHEEVYEELRDWNTREMFRLALGTCFVAAARNFSGKVLKVEGAHVAEDSKGCKLLCETLHAYTAIVDEYGYVTSTYIEGDRLLKEIRRQLQWHTFPETVLTLMTSFVNRHLEPVVTGHTQNTDTLRNRLLPVFTQYLQGLALRQDLSSTQQASTATRPPTPQDSSPTATPAEGTDVRHCTVHNVPVGNYPGYRPNFLFVEDVQTQERFYVRLDSFEGTSEEWYSLVRGSPLSIVPTAEPPPNKAQRSAIRSFEGNRSAEA